MKADPLTLALVMAATCLGQVSLQDDVDDEGQKCFKINTPTATYFYQKQGMGFSSILDKNGNDWISYKPGGGSAGEYRGIPNMGSQFHPGYTKGGTSWLKSQSDTLVSIGSKSQNGAWECRWDIRATHATMTLLKHSGTYWFLYEGTPGGGPNIEKDTDWWMISNGTKKMCNNNQNDDIASPEWIAFGDAKLPRVLLLAHHEDDSYPDKFYQMNSEMTVFGFGRSGMTTYMNSVPMHFTIALYESTDHAAIKAFAAGATGGVVDVSPRLSAPPVSADAMTRVIDPAGRTVWTGRVTADADLFTRCLARGMRMAYRRAGEPGEIRMVPIAR